MNFKTYPPVELNLRANGRGHHAVADSAVAPLVRALRNRVLDQSARGVHRNIVTRQRHAPSLQIQVTRSLRGRDAHLRSVLVDHGPLAGAIQMHVEVGDVSSDLHIDGCRGLTSFRQLAFLHSGASEFVKQASKQILSSLQTPGIWMNSNVGSPDALKVRHFICNALA